MAPHPNFTNRNDTYDAEAAQIGIAAVLKALLEELEVRVDAARVRELVGEACGDDMTQIARSMFYAQWIQGVQGVEGR